MKSSVVGEHGGGPTTLVMYVVPAHMAICFREPRNDDYRILVSVSVLTVDL